MKIRINKFLAQCGVCSRRHADALISEGQITINDKTACLGDKIDSNLDQIKYNGKIITIQPKFVYYLINKPVGYVSTTEDKHAKHKVTDLIPCKFRLFPVGRLDKNSQGLMILTNDGEFANHLMHPKYEHEKEYEVICKINKGRYDIEFIKYLLRKLAKGVALSDGKTSPAKVNNIKLLSNGLASFNIILKEGRKRQIRRMCEKIYCEVVSLIRVRINKLKLDDLAEGKFKIIKKEDII